MPSKVIESITNKKISNVSMPDEQSIYIEFENYNPYIGLIARSECCSESWFEIYDKQLNELIGNTIVDIIQDKDIDMEQSNRQECDNNHLYKIKLDETEFIFLLRNSSNGYYDGWLDIKLFGENNDINY